MYKKILFPTDNSENSTRASGYVIEIAKKFNSEVVILYSYDFPPVTYAGPLSFGYHYPAQEIEGEILNSWEILLEEIKNKFEKEGIKTKILLERGEAGPVITATAESENCELIIIGSRGLRAVKSFLMGSVSNYVIHHTACSVMIVH